MARYLTKNFTLEEMVFSQTAARRSIDNRPDRKIEDNLVRVCEAVETVRKLAGNLPVIVSSGDRSPALNAAIGGASNSAHMQGLAVDFVISRFGRPLKVARAISRSGLGYDQLIHEFTRWVHLGLAPDNMTPAGTDLSIFSGTGYFARLRAAPPIA